MKWLGLLSLAFAAACFDPTVAPSCTIACSTDTECPEGQTCNTSSGTCTAGEDCANPQTCTPGEFVACVNGAARSCNATGDGTEDSACGVPGCNVDAKRCNTCVPDEVSCSSDNTQVLTCMPDGSATTVTDTCVACVAGTQAVAAHCQYLEPKWLPNICDEKATEDLFMPNASASFDSSLDTNCNGGVVAQGSPGRQICVVRYKTITIPQFVNLTITGTRPIAFVADDALTVNGSIDAGAASTTNGPGGGSIISGAAPGATAGGGGAGFAQTGGTGGNAGGNGGASFDPTSLAYFAGGPHAGSSGGIIGLNGVAGGGGGGAVLLAACRGTATLSSTSIIDLKGGGGNPQRDTIAGSQIQNSDCGAGGGAGGYLAVEALTGVTMTGQIWANGGGGGGGSSSNEPANGGVGSDGQRSIAGANGGPGSGQGGAGGRGGFRGGNPLAGGGTTFAGGGGGSVGVVHVFTPTGVTPAITNTNMSPIPTLKMTPTR